MSYTFGRKEAYIRDGVVNVSGGVNERAKPTILVSKHVRISVLIRIITS
jgi:hypothetical protein